MEGTGILHMYKILYVVQHRNFHTGETRDWTWNPLHDSPVSYSKTIRSLKDFKFLTSQPSGMSFQVLWSAPMYWTNMKECSGWETLAVKMDAAVSSKMLEPIYKTPA
jgi:hypothetical protein